MNEFLQNFSTQLQSGGGALPFLFVVSFLGGVIASLSPCTLSVLPIIIGYIGGYEREKTTFTTFIQLLSFVFGLSVVLSIIGVICALTGQVFMALGGEFWVLFISSLVLIFGLNLLGVVEIPIPNFIKRMPKSKGASNFCYPFILGFLFALAATPCSTPILASIMSFASLSENILYSIALLFMFSLGQGLIIILTGVFTSFIKNLGGVKKYSELLMKVFGILLVLSSIYLYWKVFSRFL